MCAASKPWKQSAPKGAASTKLTAESLAWAKRRAAKAGRRYPNLVDNMAAALRQKGRAESSLGKPPAKTPD